MTAQHYQSKLFVLTCCKCGIKFGIDGDYDDRLRRDNKMFYCPSGHAQSYVVEGDAAKTKRLVNEVQNERRLRNQEASANRDEQQHLKHQVRAQKAAKTRIKNRVKNGVCPCCNRAFRDLARHMKAHHPDYGLDSE